MQWQQALKDDIKGSTVTTLGGVQVPNALVWPQKTLLPQQFASQCPFKR